MNFKEFFEANPAEVEKASKCKNLEEFKKLADEMGIDYKDEDEVKTAYNFVKGENGELSDDLLESASGGKGYAEYKGDQVYKNNKGDYVVKK